MDDDLYDTDGGGGADWLDRLGAGGMALGACIAAVLSIGVMVALNQTAASRTGEAAVPSAEEAVFEAPGTLIAREAALADAPSWRAHAEPFDPGDAQGVIAVIVLDDGTHPHVVDRALDWTVPLSFAVAADFEASPFRVKKIRRAGREALALVPMGYGTDFGAHPNVIDRHLSDGEMLRRLRWHLARGGPVVGMIDTDGGDVMRDSHAMGVLARGLEDAGALFVDSRTVAEGLAGARVRAQGVPTGHGAVRVRWDDSRDVAFDALTEAEKLAYARGTAIVLVEAGSASMDALAHWLRNRSKALGIAPVSHVVGRLRKGGL